MATMTLRQQLPNGLKPQQVRAAITVVIRRMIEAPGTFDRHGWLTVGFCGHQPAMGERLHPDRQPVSLFCGITPARFCRAQIVSGAPRPNPGFPKKSGTAKILRRITRSE